MKILVTGGNGQLGSSIRDKINFYPGLQFIFTDIDELNISDYTKLHQFITEQKPDIILNCAAYNFVDQAEKEPAKSFLLNSEAVANIAKISAELGIYLFHFSTDFIFDGKSLKPYLESDKPNPLSIYAESKWAGEQKVHKFAKDAMIVRTSWLYSEYGHNFLKTILRIANEKAEINVVNDQIGTPTYAGDLADTVLEVIAQKDIPKGVHTFHYSNKGEASWYEFASKIVEIKKLNCQVNPISSSEFGAKAARPAYSVMSKEKIKKQYNLVIPHWEVSLRKCMAKM